MSLLPDDYPARYVLANEVHARPYEALETSERASFLAVLVDPADRARERAHLATLFERFAAPVPPAEANHLSVSLGTFRIKWERHGEFSVYTVFVRGRSPQPFSEPAFAALPADWLRAIPGRTIVAAHAKLVAVEGDPADAAMLSRMFEGNAPIGSEIGGGAGFAFTDFKIHADGCVRFLVLDRRFTPRQAGRMLQRLFEIETYRVLALMALPVARAEGPRVARIEGALGALTDRMAREDGADEKLLGQLTGLAAEVESAIATSQYRFGASRAYHKLVDSRIAELRESRLPGLQTIGEFMGRRLAPAMATCESTAGRMAGLSERVARTSALLSTRVEIARERQNQALLASMDRRAQLQLRMQATVEGLSTAAITYYVVGLIGYAAKALKAAGLHVDPEQTIGIAIPFVVLLVALGIRRMRRKLVGHEHD